jgi:cytochrome c
MGRFFALHQANDELGAAVKRGKEIFEAKGCGRCHPGGGTIGRTRGEGFPIPDLHGARDRYPRVMTPKRIVVTLAQMNDVCATVFLNQPPMDPDSQEYVDLAAYVASLRGR